MNTKKFGPPLWETLHIISANYPEKPKKEDKIKYKEYFRTLTNILPCKYCRVSYCQFWEVLPIDNYLDSRIQMMYWLYLVHNMVNKKLRIQGNKVAPDPTFFQVVKKYEKIRAKSH